MTSSSRMPSGPKSNRCGVTSNPPPVVPRASATGCSSKPSSPSAHRHAVARPARGVRGRECRVPAVPPLGHAYPLDHVKALFIDSTIVRAHQHTAGVPNKTPAQDPGRSRGAVQQDARGLPRRPHRSLVRAERGRAPRCGWGRAGVAGLQAAWAGLGGGDGGRDNASDSQAIRHVLGARGSEDITPRGMPPNALIGGRLAPRRWPMTRSSKLRERVKRCFNKLKPCRRMATR